MRTALEIIYVASVFLQPVLITATAEVRAAVVLCWWWWCPWRWGGDSDGGRKVVAMVVVIFLS